MGSIGEYFRLVRETKRLSMDEVAMKTRIHSEFLKALEEENFAKLPDQVFVKGFVRSYARSLGLEEEEAIRRFDESAGAFYSKQDEREKLRVRQAEDERRRKANKKAVAAAAGVALLVLALLFTREQSAVSPDRSGGSEVGRRTAVLPPPIKPVDAVVKERPREGSSEARPAPDLLRKPTDPSTGAVASAVPEKLPPQPAVPSLPPPPEIPSVVEPAVSERLQLELQALELTWVLVQVDEGQPQEVLLKRGDRVRWSASDKFVLTLGNAGGVQVEMNGKPQGPFGPTGKVVRDIILARQ
jgi:cytoskeletal protein RodZ